VPKYQSKDLVLRALTDKGAVGGNGTTTKIHGGLAGESGGWSEVVSALSGASGRKDGNAPIEKLSFED
jgi:hypothetical protein